jgi:hypothetical protein
MRQIPAGFRHNFNMISLPKIPVFLLCAATCAAHAAELHVATTGDDKQPGTSAAPLRTIQRAADLAQPGDTIIVQSGPPE